MNAHLQQLSQKGLTLGAVILAGGLARRMDGRDKGLIELAGKPMLKWALENVKPQAHKVVINANRNHEQYAAIAADVIADSHEGHLGPLAGLSAAIAWLKTDYVFMCPCDSPFLPPNMVERLYRAMEEADAGIAVARDAERQQPVFLLVNRRSESSLNAFLDSGERKIDRWFDKEKLVEADFSDYPDAFRNINTEEERLAVESIIN